MTTVAAQNTIEKNTEQSPASGSSGPVGHLEKKQAQLKARHDSLQAEMREAEQAVADVFRPAEQSTASLNQAFHALCRDKQVALYKRAHAASAWKCLKLDTLGMRKSETGNPAALAWAAIIGTYIGLSYLLPSWLGIARLALAGAAAYFVYRRFLARARTEFALLASQDSIDALKRLDDYQVTTIRVGLTPSGDNSYPYAYVQVKPGAEQPIDNCRTFNQETCGDLYGATLVGLISPKLQNSVGFWIKLPTNGHAMVVLDLTEKQAETARLALVAEELSALVLRHAPALSAALDPLYAQVERRRSALAELEWVKVKMQSVSSQEAAWRNVAINHEPLEQIVVQLELFKLAKAGAPKGMLLYGPPGSGKTQVARALATESGLAFQAVSTSEIKGSSIGESGKRIKRISTPRAAGPLASCLSMRSTS